MPIMRAEPASRTWWPTPSARRTSKVDLVARQGTTKLASGREFDGFTLNGKTPGPKITATEGQLVEVNLRNASVEDGVSLHWHGVDVPNAEDGVAGVTQDAVQQGGEHTYRFVADQVGTFWYHSHQVSHEQVIGGLLGSLVILPKDGIEQDQDLLGRGPHLPGNPHPQRLGGRHPRAGRAR